MLEPQNLKSFIFYYCLVDNIEKTRIKDKAITAQIPAIIGARLGKAKTIIVHMIPIPNVMIRQHQRVNAYPSLFLR